MNFLIYINLACSTLGNTETGSGGDDLRALGEGQPVMMLHSLITQSCTVAFTAS